MALDANGKSISIGFSSTYIYKKIEDKTPHQNPRHKLQFNSSLSISDLP
jgi:hypothetical protein